MKFTEKAITKADLKAEFIGDQLFTGHDIYVIYFNDEGGVVVTGVQLNDIIRGYNDRYEHCYDKWYRYNRTDEGRAYDFGQRLFCVRVTHSCLWIQEDQGFQIIEVQK